MTLNVIVNHHCAFQLFIVLVEIIRFSHCTSDQLQLFPMTALHFAHVEMYLKVIIIISSNVCSRPNTVQWIFFFFFLSSVTWKIWVGISLMVILGPFLSTKNVIVEVWPLLSNQSIYRVLCGIESWQLHQECMFWFFTKLRLLLDLCIFTDLCLLWVWEQGSLCLISGFP